MPNFSFTNENYAQVTNQEFKYYSVFRVNQPPVEENWEKTQVD